MSYILDALKKIEHEKNRKLNSSGKINISGDLFLERKPPEARTGSWKIAAVVALASLVTCAGTWFVLKENGKKSVVSIPPTASQAPDLIPPTIPQAVTPAVSLPAQVQPQPSVVVQPAPKRAVTAGGHDVSRLGTYRVKNQPLNQSPSSRQPVHLVPAPADIKLSGIAWQDARSARRAVVNGFLLKEGAVVSGATITDIQTARVRFTSAAGQFEVMLDAVLPAGGVR